MDPVAVLGIVECSISLAVKCSSIAKSLNTLARHHKHAKLTVSTMVQNLDIMQLAWDRIGAWSRDFMPMDDALTQRLEKFLETGSLVLDALEEDLESYDVSNMTFSQRSRLVWNENRLQSHQGRIRDQAQSMSLLLQAIQLPTPQATTNLLQESQKQFIKSDESALSIVPSKLSSRLSLSTAQTGRRDSADSYASMVYRQLSFEDELFTAQVYKRNYRFPQLRRHREIRSAPRDDAVTLRQGKRQESEGNVHVNFQRLAQGTDTFEISTDTAPENAEEVAKERASVAILSIEDMNHDLQHGVGSSASGRNGMYQKTTEYLEQRVGSAASDEYVRLVRFCERGYESLVETQLAKVSEHHSARQLALHSLNDISEVPKLPPLLSSNLSGSMYLCPIQAAVFNGHVGSMRKLLEHAGTENDVSHVVEKVIGGTEDDRWRPLHVATLQGNLPMVKFHLESGASVLRKTGHGIQAAHLAARIGSIDISML